MINVQPQVEILRRIFAGYPSNPFRLQHSDAAEKAPSATPKAETDSGHFLAARTYRFRADSRPSAMGSIAAEPVKPDGAVCSLLIR
jgi:hypothetical protein